MKYVVDTSLINKLVDGSAHADELPTDGAFVALHIQYDELNQTKNLTRRSELLAKFNEIIDEIFPSESSVFGISRFGNAGLGNGVSYEAIKADLDLLNNGKTNNSKDALIAECAMKNGYVLLTADYHLYQVAITQGIGVIYWTTNTKTRKLLG